VVYQNAVCSAITDRFFFRHGDVLMKTCKSFQAAETEINERTVHVINIWSRIDMQLEFMKEIESTFSVEHRNTQEATLEVLAVKLKCARTKLGALLGSPDVARSGTRLFDVKRWKYVRTKTGLDECIGELQAWQTIFDPSWFLTMRIARQYSQILDEKLESHTTGAVIKSAASVRNAIRPGQSTAKRLLLPAGSLQFTHAERVLYSTASFVPRPKSTKWVIIDPIPYGDTDHDMLARSVRGLATKLASVDPSVFNILKCRGFIKLPSDANGPGALNLVFDTPDSSSRSPQSLRHHLAERTPHGLTDRFAFARQVANAIGFVHTLGFVHKNVRPENFIEFGSKDTRLGSLYLIGFEQVRTVDGRTYRRGDSMWSKDLYRHPARQGATPSEDYCMQHDIYGLGVCLLEIGLWDSFLTYDADGEPQTAVAALHVDLKNFEGQPPSAVKDHLVHLAETQLPLSMGTVFKDVVVNCLTCLDDGNVDFGDRAEFEDEDGVLMGVRYIEKVSHTRFPRPRPCEQETSADQESRSW
jgi:serine/threonine protein kinase